jgi:hypothetical protein
MKAYWESGGIASLRSGGGRAQRFLNVGTL